MICIIQEDGKPIQAAFAKHGTDGSQFLTGLDEDT
jgi:hypothetical protein